MCNKLACLCKNGSRQITGSSTAFSPMIKSLNKDTKVISIFTTGDTVNVKSLLNKYDNISDNYYLVGMADGLGIVKDGTNFYLTCNHELRTEGAGRRHTTFGTSRGAFVSKWKINSKTLSVEKGEDLAAKLYVWDVDHYRLADPTKPSPAYDLNNEESFSWLCSATVPPVTALFNNNTKLGTTSRIHFCGEEMDGSGRAFAFVINGINGGYCYELPVLGRGSFENINPCPFEQNKTVIVCTNDAPTTYVDFDNKSFQPISVWVGYKKKEAYVNNEPTTPLKASGLEDGQLYGIYVVDYLDEHDTPYFGLTKGKTRKFELIPLLDQRQQPIFYFNSSDPKPSPTFTEMRSKGCTSFFRPEDGDWDPLNPNHYYVACTGNSTYCALYRFEFANIRNPALGGKMRLILTNHDGVTMIDNLGFDKKGNLAIVEDGGFTLEHPTNNFFIYNTFDATLTKIACLDQNNMYVKGLQGTGTGELSGVISAADVLGDNWWILTAFTYQPIDSFSNLPADMAKECAYMTQLVAVYYAPKIE